MSEVLDGYADSGRQAALLAHVADCAACRAEWLVIQQVDHLLMSAPRVSPPADFTPKVMARLTQRRPAQHPWAGALALFAGTILLLFFAGLSLIGVGSPSEPTTGLLALGGGTLLQFGGVLTRWLQAGWEARQAMLGLIPFSLIVLYAFLALVALVMWLGLIAGVQGVNRTAGK